MSLTRSAPLLRALPALLALGAFVGQAAAFAPDQAHMEADQGVSSLGAPGTGTTAPSGTAASASASAAAIVWNDPAHIQYFKYEVYLEGYIKRQSANLPYETKDSWAKLTPEVQTKDVSDGEKFLKDKFGQLMNGYDLSNEDKLLVQAVWGDDVSAALHNVQVARQSGDPKLLAAAIASVGKLSSSIGNLAKVDWNKFFENGGSFTGGSITVDDAPSETPAAEDPLAVQKTVPFLEALKSPQIKAVLASQASFDQFVHSRPEGQVSPAAYKSLSAMYAVLTAKAKDPADAAAINAEKAQVAHILPTVVKFIQDGKKIMPEGDAPAGALAWAVADSYGKPVEVAIGPAIVGSDPLVVGNVLSHEFEHIYDDYTGRIYTLDSELRGFKVNVTYTKILRMASPENYKRLTQTNDDNTRQQMGDFIESEKAYDLSYGKTPKPDPEAFANEVAYGHHYIEETQGYIAEARVPLRDAIGPSTLGLPRALAATKGMRDEMLPQIAALVKQRDAIQTQRLSAPSRTLDDEYQRVATDLNQARARYASYDSQAMIQQDQLTRLQTEAKWLNAKSTKGTPPKYDLSLPVDGSYLAP